MMKNKGIGDALVAADAVVADAAEPLRDTPAMRALGWLSDAGDQPPLRLLCGALIAAGLLRGDARQARAGLRMLAAHEVATFAKSFVKHRVDRTRPRSRGEGGDDRPRAGSSRAKEDSSFPSGHTAGAVATARAFARAYPDHAVPAHAAAALIALAQIPRCAHYPTDVAAGAAIGLAGERLASAGFDRLAAPVEHKLRRAVGVPDS